MKYIKSINEFYHRTVGFRYSKPTEKYSVICYYQGELSTNILKEIFDDNQISYEDIVIEPGQEDIKTANGDMRVDGVAYFDILVYTSKEIEKILSDIESNLFTESDVRVVDFSVRPYPKKADVNNETFNIGVNNSIAKKIEPFLDTETTYSFNDIAKVIANKGGVAAMHSRDVKEIIDELKKDGYKINEMLDPLGKWEIEDSQSDVSIDTHSKEGKEFVVAVKSILEKDDVNLFTDLLSKYNLSVKSVTKLNHYYICRMAVINGALNIFKLMIDKVDSSISKRDMNLLLCWPCENGRKDMASYVANKFSFDESDIKNAMSWVNYTKRIPDSQKSDMLSFISNELKYRKK